ncbi:MAG: hypothetical protein PHC62_10170 [Candidatus Izemoplasmatales bacterium]|nr:hypothetical protein [Candidatus Izemoplasmatales bacterium]
MPRGKSKTLDEKISELNSSIQDLETKKQKLDDKIKALNKQKQSLLDAANQEKLQQLQMALAETGLSIDEALDKIKNL